MEFLRSFLRRHLAGKPVVASPNVGYFLRLLLILNYRKYQKQSPSNFPLVRNLSYGKWFFYLQENINYFHFKDIILNYILKIRLDGTRKRPTGIILQIFLILSKEIHNTSSFPGSFPTRSPNSREGTSRTGTR